MKARIIRSSMSFSEFTIDIPAIPRNGDHISIYCDCPWDETKIGTRDYDQKHVPGCPVTINWYVRGIGFHGTFPEGYAEHRDREVVIDTSSITIMVDERNPHTWPEVYGLPYDPNDEDLKRFRAKDMAEWKAAGRKLSDEHKDGEAK